MRPRSLVLLFALSTLACGGPIEPADAGPDGGPDAGPEAMDLSFEARADPLERLDCASTPAAAGEARAKHVRCADELPSGVLAMGQVGDVLLENALARFVIRAGDESATTIGGPSGGLIDAAPVGGSDFVKEVLPLLDFSSIRPSAITVVDAGGDEARVRVLFEDAPIGLIETVVPGLGRSVRARGQLDYVLRADEPFLRVEVTVTTREGIATGVARGGLLALLGGQEEVQPGWGVLDADATGGAGHQVVAEREDGAIALGLEAREGASLLRVGTIHLLQGARLPYARGVLSRFGFRLAVGPSAAEAYAALSSSDAAPSTAPLTITGAVGDRIEVRRDGVPVLRSRLGEDARASIPLPPGSYEVRPGFDGFFEAPAVAVLHGEVATSVTIPAAPSGTLRIEASVEGDATAPVRVTVERAGEELLRFVALGPTERRVPPGELHVVVSHGLEHDLVEADVTSVAGAVTTLSPVLDRAIDTTGWVSVDLHLHSELSTDSTHRLEDALRMIAAENVEVVSSTDHDFINDHARHTARAGVEGRIVLVPGEEVSTTVFGHVNGYPLAPDAALAGAGAFVWFDRSPAEVFAGLRARGDAALGGALVQVNHPRLENGLFDAIGLDLDTGRATADPASLDLPPETDLDDLSFDVIEVWNGYTRGDNEASFEDYLALFAAGRRFAMVGNSDSHRPTLPAGSPRSFVRVPDDSRGAFGWAEVGAALRAREVTVAGGIFVTAELAGPRSGGSIPLHVRVQAAPWVEADRVRVYAGRSVVLERALGASSDPIRLDETLTVPLGGADFVVVRAEGSRAPEPAQHFAPYGVTNAILVP